jgi:hypothetical protein
MWRLILVALLLGGCSKGSEEDLQYIKQARSASAEWALTNEEANRGQLTTTYVASMHKWIRQEIQSSATGLSQPQSPYGAEIQALLRLPDDASPEQLRAHSDELKHIEDSLESA